jgi:quercetin dioxygenase-like cupin family protein
MIPEDVQALALADAIGALDPHERLDLEDRLATLPADVRAEVAQLYDAAVEISSTISSESPSPNVRAALLARIAAPSNHTVMASHGEWVQTPLRGVRMKILAIDRQGDRVTMLLRGEPGATYPAHRHTGAEECYVISGSLVIEGQLLRAGDFHHAEGGSHHGQLRTDEGVEVLLVAAASDYVPELMRRDG